MISALTFAWLCLSTMFLILWLIHLRINNAGIVDLGWGMGFIMLVLIYTDHFEGYYLRDLMLISLIVVWGLRITFFLIKRLAHERGEDGRYQIIRQAWGRHIALKFFILFSKRIAQPRLSQLTSLPLTSSLQSLPTG